MKRRKFLELFGLVVSGGFLNGCGGTFENPNDDADRQVEIKAPNETTISDALHATGHYPAIVSRQLNGKSHDFIVGVDGHYEQPELNKYWLFWVNDKIVIGPLDEVLVSNGDHIIAVLMVPSMLHA